MPSENHSLTFSPQHHGSLDTNLPIMMYAKEFGKH